MNFRKKLILSFILVSLITTLFFQNYIVGRYSNQQREKIFGFIDQGIYQKKNILNNEIVDYQKIIINLMADKIFTETMNSLLKGGNNNTFFLENIIVNIFSQNTYMKEGLIGFLYYDWISDFNLGYNKQLINTEDLFSSLGGRGHVIDIIEKNSGVITYIDTITVKNFANISTNLIVLGSRFSDFNRITQRGHIFILISEQSIFDLLNPKDLMDSSIFSETSLITSSGIMVSGKDKSKLSSVISNTVSHRLKGGDKLLSRNVHIERIDWLIVTLFREKELFGEVVYFQVFIFFIGLLSLSFTIFIIRNYIFRIVNSVTALRSSLKIENDQLHFSVTTDDDLEYVNQSFKNMKEHINVLLLEQKNKTLELLKIQEAKRLAEIRAIEAQVNPHFLYNTLNSLNWIAIENDDSLMSGALTDLASILRYSITDIETYTTLQKEMEWLEQYLRLQKVRFVDLFDYKLDWEPDAAGFLMHKLLFQPFIENAIIHGFSGIEYLGKLIITAKYTIDRKLVITIEDNGNGFDISSIKKSTGLNNPVSRMKLYWKGNSEFEIQSVVGKGTTISLTIPECNSENIDS